MAKRGRPAGVRNGEGKNAKPSGPLLLLRFSKKHCLSSDDIAVRLVPRPESQAVSRWWNGTRRPSMSYRIQLEQIAGIPVSAWRTEGERREAEIRAKWIESHPTSFRTKIDLATLDPGEEVSEEEDAEEEIEAETVGENDEDDDPEPKPPKPPKRKKERARDAPPLPKHDLCTAADPIGRLGDLRRERFEIIDSGGSVLLLSHDFCAAKRAMDSGEIPGASSVRCKDCKADLARIAIPQAAATEGLVKVANRVGHRIVGDESAEVEI